MAGPNGGPPWPAYFMTEPLSETPRPEPRFSFVALLLALAVGAAGGALFAYLRLPLPWMLGAMSATTIAALMGLRMQMPRRLRMPMSAVIGVMLGATFTPDLVDRIATWTVTIVGLLVYAIVAGGLVMAYLRRVAGYDARTAYFSSSPGGLGEMTLIAGDMGADERIVRVSRPARSCWWSWPCRFYSKFSANISRLIKCCHRVRRWICRSKIGRF